MKAGGVQPPPGPLICVLQAMVLALLDSARRGATRKAACSELRLLIPTGCTGSNTALTQPEGPLGSRQ